MNNFLAFEKDPDFAHDQAIPIVAESPDLHREIDHGNGWLEDGEFNDEQMKVLFKISSQWTHEFFRFIFGGRKLNRLEDRKTVQRRTYSLGKLMCPELLVDDKARMMTWESLAAIPEIKCSKFALSSKADDFGKTWKFHSSIQKRHTTRETYSASAKAAWVNRRKKPKQANGNGSSKKQIEEWIKNATQKRLAIAQA